MSWGKGFDSWQVHADSRAHPAVHFSKRIGDSFTAEREKKTSGWRYHSCASLYGFKNARSLIYNGHYSYLQAL